MNLGSKVFNCEGIKEHKHIAYGRYNGFNATISTPYQGEPIIEIYYTKDGDDEKKSAVIAKLNSELQRMVDNEKIVRNFAVTPFKVTITIKSSAFSVKKNIENTKNVLDKAINLLKLESCISGCSICGTTTANWYTVNDTVTYFCDTCYGNLNVELQNEMLETKAKKSNIAGGIVGALLGSAIGAILWIIIYQLGYIAAIGGLVIVVLAMLGYKKLGKHLDVKGVIISMLVSGLMLYVAIHLSISIMIYRELAQYGISLFDISANLFEILKEANAMGDFYKDLILGYILYFVGGIAYSISALKEAKGSYKINKL